MRRFLLVPPGPVPNFPEQVGDNMFLALSKNSLLLVRFLLLFFAPPRPRPLLLMVPPPLFAFFDKEFDEFL